MDVNLNYLKIFIEAAESNSISEVAKKTGYNSANISILIKKFEEQLGVTLFTRNPLKLTKIGKDIYECSRKGYRDIEFINTIIKNKNDIRYGDAH